MLQGHKKKGQQVPIRTSYFPGVNPRTLSRSGHISGSSRSARSTKDTQPAKDTQQDPVLKRRKQIHKRNGKKLCMKLSHGLSQTKKLGQTRWLEKQKCSRIKRYLKFPGPVPSPPMWPTHRPAPPPFQKLIYTLLHSVLMTTFTQSSYLLGVT